MTTNLDKIKRLIISDGAGVFFFVPNSGQGFSELFRSAQLADASLRTVCSRIERMAGTSLTKMEIKIVGDERCCQRLKLFFEREKSKLMSVTVRSEPMETLFYPSTGRLRVAPAKEQEKPVPCEVNRPSLPLRATKTNRRTRVLIVDDSQTIRQLLSRTLSSDPDIEVVGAAAHPAQVESMILRHSPDVLTLDIHMPEMDGVTLLRQLLPKFHLPAVMITSVSAEDGRLVLDALEAGAVDYIQKPSLGELSVLGPEIIERVKTAATAKVTRRATSQPARHNLVNRPVSVDPNRVIAIGSSTGGTEALKEIMIRLPAQIPPILIVQHIPPIFSAAFASRLNDLCPFEVKEAQDGDRIVADRVLIAPGGKHMRVVKAGAGFKVVIEETALRNRHRPSVDVLFDSVADCIGRNATGIVLTGMGNDGATGLLKMRQAGATTCAQDEASCAVYGMPREAVKLNAAQQILDLFNIPQFIIDNFGRAKAG